MRGFLLINRTPAETSPVVGIEKLTSVDESQWGMIGDALRKRFSRPGASIDITKQGLGSKNLSGDDVLVLTVDYGHGFRSPGKAGRKRAKCALVPATGRGIFRPKGVEYYKVRCVRSQVI